MHPAPAPAPALDGVAAPQPPDGVVAAPAGAVERSRRRDVAHGSLLAVGWLTIALLWVRVLDATAVSTLVLAGASVLVCAVLTLVLTSLWISHNVAIHGAKGPRGEVTVAPLRYDRDWTGRAVAADWAAVGTAGVVVIASSPSRKVFLADPSSDVIDDAVDPVAGDSLTCVGTAS